MYYRNHSQGASTLGFRFYVEVKSTFIRIAPSARMLARPTVSLTTGNRQVPRADVGSRREPESPGTVPQTSFRHTRMEKVCETVESESQYSRRAHGVS